MKKLLKFVGGRLVITAVLIVIQVVWMLMFLLELVGQVTWLRVVFELLSLTMVLFVIRKDDNPAYKIPWIVVITLFPLFGGPMYILFGNKRPARRMRDRLGAQREKTSPLLGQDGAAAGHLLHKSARAASTARYIAQNGPYPLWENTATKYYPLGDDMYPDMLQDIERAEHYIFMEYFILNDGVMLSTILDALERKARAGVDVRLMYDDMGCVSRVPPDFPAQIERRGIRCMAFNRFVPLISMVMNNRDHRKILVVDGYVGYTGGLNLADEYINRIVRFGHWKDTGVRLEGDAVWNFTVMFLEMWNTFRPAESDWEMYRPHVHHPAPFASDGFVQPFGDSPLDNEPLSENVYIDLLSQATDYAYIFTPYLVIDNEMQTALCMAAKRGVDVRVFTPGIPDKKTVYQLTRSYYPPLIDAGVRVYEYTPGFLHAKSFVVDDKVAVVGTINLDYRSLYLHFECGVFLYGARSILDVKQDALDTLGRCREITQEHCRKGMRGGLMNAVLRLFAPML